MSVRLLFTSYPVVSETFLQREVKALQDLGLDFSVHSLWGGKSVHDGVPVQLFEPWKWILILYWLPYWLICEPGKTFYLLKLPFSKRAANWTNFFEMILGTLFGFIHAREMEHRQVSMIHAVWASAPAGAGLVIHYLTGIPFSFGAHAYDLFEDGGDGWIQEKIEVAEFIRTSTTAGADRLKQFGARKSRIHVIRRGLNGLPDFDHHFQLHSPLRILSVGRLVEKMGYSDQLAILSDLRNHEVSFEARIVGDGPLGKILRQEAHELGLDESIQWDGRIPFEEVVEALNWADVLLFTGKVAKSGDRAGLPNAVAEGMAWGVPVFATRVGAVKEVLEDEQNGILITPEDAADRIQQFCQNETKLNEIRSEARSWVEENYRAKVNMKILMDLLQGSS